MDHELVTRVRAFNRTVTQRVGALHDHYLSLDHTLGEARVLWEIGDGCDVRSLRARLDLDSGYTSRLLRSLEASGFAEVTPSASDGRVRVARLTRRGRAERARLDRRSDDLARSMLAPLTAAQQQRLVEAMDTVGRLLTAALVQVEPVDPSHPDAQHCLRAYYAELDARFDAGFDPARALPVEPEEMRLPHGLFLVAKLREDPIGCGALKFRPRRPTEIKRVWVAPEVRGLGVGRRVLAALEEHAAASGARRVRLDTNRALTEAIAMYRSAGYQEIPAFNTEPYAHHWFEKRLRPVGRVDPPTDG